MGREYHRQGEIRNTKSRPKAGRKSEIRGPKSEGNPKSEGRDPKAEEAAACALARRVQEVDWLSFRGAFCARLRGLEKKLEKSIDCSYYRGSITPVIELCPSPRFIAWASGNWKS
jgi:hypothetical protein